MSHFSLAVIVAGPADEDFDAQSAVEAPLEPFDENKTMPRYKYRMDEGETARMLRHYRVEQLKGHPEGTKRMRKKPYDLTEKQLLARMAKVGLVPLQVQDLVQFLKDWCGHVGGYDEKKGGLWHWSTYNPKSHWDWYQVGGRWGGMMGEEDFRPVKDILADIEANADLRAKYLEEVKAQRGRIAEYVKKQAAEKGEPEPKGEEMERAINGVKWGLDLSAMGGNEPEDRKALHLQMPDEEIEKATNASFFAMLKLDGEWIEKGEMGWFGMSSDDKPEDTWFETQVAAMKEAVEEDPDAVLVLVDCHI